jgi:biopolymer transport protein ExbB
MTEFLDRFVSHFLDLWSEAVEIWSDGGWAMIAIAVIALVMFSVGFNVYFKLRAKGFQSLPERTWRRWIDHPLERRGRIGELMDVVTDATDLEEINIYFDELRATETVPFERDLLVMKICVSCAPLVGLLGTVTGMLATFGALSSGSGGDKTMEMIAAGISEALITTETGLVIALPGLFFQYQLGRAHESYKAFLAHLNSVCTQRLYRELESEKRAAVEAAARQEASAVLQDHLRARLAGPSLSAGSPS